MMKWIWRSLLAVVLLIVVVAIAGLAYREVVQSRAEAQLAITSPNGIDDALYVPIRGSEQWITIRGRDKSNPVVLIVHGGPGFANAPFVNAMLPYEQSYTLVQWDQPGAAKTFRRAGNTIPADLTIADVVDDGIAVAELVKERLHADKIVLLGWSWGSMVGIEMARKRPDLFAAYVGTGQLVSLAANEAMAYANVLATARQRGVTQAIKELEAIGPPPYDSYGELATERKWAGDFAGGNESVVALLALAMVGPRYSIADVVSYVRGLLASQDHFMGPTLDGPIFHFDLGATATELEVPIVFIQGTDDNVTPAALARDYFDRLTAPQKAYVPIEGGGHAAIVDNTGAFVAALNEHVRPLIR
jgi:pimeloyl-ACP methyl ester carboxylesterase